MLKNSGFALLDTASVIYIHSRLLSIKASAETISCNYGLIDSAVSSTKNLSLYHPEKDIFELAANYGFHIGKNHAFGDGNKRTAYFSMYVFFAVNGATVEESVFLLKKAYKNLESLVIGKIDQVHFAEILRKRYSKIVNRKWWQYWIPKLAPIMEYQFIAPTEPNVIND